MNVLPSSEKNERSVFNPNTEKVPNPNVGKGSKFVKVRASILLIV